MTKKTSSYGLTRSGNLETGQYAVTTRDQAYQLAASAEDFFLAKGIICEKEQTVSKERSPNFSFKWTPLGFEVSGGVVWKTTTVTRIIPVGGGYSDE